MNADKLIASLERFGAILPIVVRDVPLEDAQWRPPSPDPHWSILEIVRHLVDEEVEDFRTRLRLTLQEPQSQWRSIDPEGWAVHRKYNESRLDEATERFATERGTSVKWLRGLLSAAPSGRIDWSSAHVHPKFGPIHGGDLLAAWAAHDELHLRQIDKRLFQLATRDGGNFSVRYAGEWGA
jgi:hypothetical protein